MNKTMIIAAVAVAIAAGGGYWAGTHRGDLATAKTAAKPDEKKVLYWYDPMSPSQHFDKPGKSPFMDMQLLPKYADDEEVARLEIDPKVSQNLGMRLATVERAAFAQSVSAPAVVQFNDRDVALVQARAAGFVQKVYARAPGDVVARDAPLADILVPDWVGAQEEFLAVLRTSDKSLAAASRQRLSLLGMPEAAIEEVARSGKSQARFTFTAPISGVIQELGVRTGMTLAQGAMVARINGLGSVWLEAAVPQSQAEALHVGQLVKVAISGRTTFGKVIAMLPQLEPTSRTLRVRVELPNHTGEIRPGMFAQMEFATGTSTPQLIIPSEAVVRTGARNLVMVASGNGQYVPVAVQLGEESGGKTVVLAGLNEGDRVVASGQFLLDSEASLRGIHTKEPAAQTDSDAPSAAKPAASVVHQGIGMVESVNEREIVLTHEPIASLGWSAMTMPFALASPALARNVKPGDTVHFGLVKAGDGYVIKTLHKMGGAS